MHEGHTHVAANIKITYKFYKINLFIYKIKLFFNS